MTSPVGSYGAMMETIKPYRPLFTSVFADYRCQINAPKAGVE